MPQTNDDIGKRALGWAAERIHKATEKHDELQQHKGGYTANYKSGLLSEYRGLVKEAQQLLHYAVEKIPNATQTTSNPTESRLKELRVIKDPT